MAASSCLWVVAIAFATASALEGSALAAAGGLSKHFLRSHGGIVAEYDLTNQEAWTSLLLLPRLTLRMQFCRASLSSSRSMGGVGSVEVVLYCE